MTLRNLALARPANQSSISKYSRSQTTGEDAQGANNGVVDGAAGFRTARQDRPWWQVDLGRDAKAIREVRIYNDAENFERLTNFTVLLSDDRTKWKAVHRKTDSGTFGRSASEFYSAVLDEPASARWLRIRMDGEGVLQFCECEVLGDDGEATPLEQLKPVTAQPDAQPIAATHGKAAEAVKERPARLREPAAQAAQELAPPKEASPKPAEKRTGQAARKPGGGGPTDDQWAKLGAVEVFIDRDRYSPKVREQLSAGSYEEAERALVRKALNADDRVLEVGCAIGAVSMSIANIVGPAALLSFDANPQMVADAQRNFAHNGLEAIAVKTAVLLNEKTFAKSPAQIDFHVSSDFRSSRLKPAAGAKDIVQVIKVDVACLEAERAAHRANVLLCDIEGGEGDLLMGAKLDGLRLLALKVNRHRVGDAAVDALIRRLTGQGFGLDFHWSGHGIAVLRRR
ncbi:MAG TPA: FkbM family methyltransferase [Caulobacteraceae bacterium]|jgi:FkbM family methyltransferase|nr:FkbM family methyltransferase [Caulobacteraceae bacterium]